MRNPFKTKPIDNQGGSVIVVALLLLLLMSIIGISATMTSVTESFIIRNEGITRQNLNLAEAAAIELAHRVLLGIEDQEARQRLSTASTIAMGREDYIVSQGLWDAGGVNSRRNTWYSPNTLGRVFDGAPGVTFPQYFVPEFLDETTLIDTVRAEGNDPLRAALVGWTPGRGGGGPWSLRLTSTPRRAGRIMAEYVSPDYGVTRLEIGIERAF